MILQTKKPLMLVANKNRSMLDNVEILLLYLYINSQDVFHICRFLHLINDSNVSVIFIVLRSTV